MRLPVRADERTHQATRCSAMKNFICQHSVLKLGALWEAQTVLTGKSVSVM